MNTQQQIDQILDSRKRLAESHNSLRSDYAKKEEKEDHLGHMADMFDGLADLITKNTQTVRVQNQPKNIGITGPVSFKESDELIGALEDLEQCFEESIDEMKREVTKAITAIPESKETIIPPYPEHPKQIKSDITSLPKYVGEGLDNIRKAVKELKTTVTVTPTPVVLEPTDLSPLLASLKAVQEEIKALTGKEAVVIEKPDFSGLEGVLAGIASGINDVRNNTSIQTSQTFTNSWEKSFDMQSKDMATTFTYITHASSGKKVVSYIQVTSTDGVYRRTFTFDTEGDVVSATKWTLQ